MRGLRWGSVPAGSALLPVRLARVQQAMPKLNLPRGVKATVLAGGEPGTLREALTAVPRFA